MKMPLSSLFTSSFIFFCSLSCIATALVPPSETFNYVNDGEFGFYIVEYGGDYRPLPVGASPFQLAFYNTTPGEYTLAIRMATRRSTSLIRWVWEANRGKPVGENATFSLGTNGNLVLAEAGGRVVWQSNTADKGVVGFQFLPTGNMILHDSKGSVVWQSFDSPTDTLLVGQSLRLTGPSQLVSRFSASENRNGPYSLVLEPKRLSLYYKSAKSPNPMLYYRLSSTVNLDVMTLIVESRYEGLAYAIRFINQDGTDGLFVTRPNYNATLSLLRLGIDGGLRALSYYDPVDYQAWQETFTLFERDFGEECQLPERCGDFGLCEDSQCVACPSPNGLLGWSKTCAPPKITSCKDVKYYKIEGVNHFMSKYTRGTGPITQADCQRKCTSDCKCAGFFFKQAESRCWVVSDLKTLTKVDNSTHVGFIKTPAH